MAESTHVSETSGTAIAMVSKDTLRVSKTHYEITRKSGDGSSALLHRELLTRVASDEEVIRDLRMLVTKARVVTPALVLAVQDLTRQVMSFIGSDRIRAIRVPRIPEEIRDNIKADPGITIMWLLSIITEITRFIRDAQNEMSEMVVPEKLEEEEDTPVTLEGFLAGIGLAPEDATGSQ